MYTQHILWEIFWAICQWYEFFSRSRHWLLLRWWKRRSNLPLLQLLLLLLLPSKWIICKWYIENFNLLCILYFVYTTSNIHFYPPIWTWITNTKYTSFTWIVRNYHLQLAVSLSKSFGVFSACKQLCENGFGKTRCGRGRGRTKRRDASNFTSSFFYLFIYLLFGHSSWNIYDIYGTIILMILIIYWMGSRREKTASFQSHVIQVYFVFHIFLSSDIDSLSFIFCYHCTLFNQFFLSRYINARNKLSNKCTSMDQYNSKVSGVKLEMPTDREKNLPAHPLCVMYFTSTLSRVNSNWIWLPFFMRIYLLANIFLSPLVKVSIAIELWKIW